MTLKSEIILETAEYVSSVLSAEKSGMDSLGEVLTNIAFQSLWSSCVVANATSG
jgi:hypothetical protein